MKVHLVLGFLRCIYAWGQELGLVRGKSVNSASWISDQVE